uniref:Putative secreted protein n=1 Tax=Ixodes ricinus TaxID=34613 RepID=A0A6B0V553_IXORI
MLFTRKILLLTSMSSISFRGMLIWALTACPCCTCREPSTTQEEDIVATILTPDTDLWASTLISIDSWTAPLGLICPLMSTPPFFIWDFPPTLMAAVADPLTETRSGRPLLAGTVKEVSAKSTLLLRSRPLESDIFTIHSESSLKGVAALPPIWMPAISLPKNLRYPDALASPPYFSLTANFFPSSSILLSLMALLERMVFCWSCGNHFWMYLSTCSARAPASNRLIFLPKMSKDVPTIRLLG